MTQELSKQLVCIQMRSGVEIWLEADRAAAARAALLVIKENKFIHIDQQVVNTADIVGIFTADVMEALTRRKNGEWKCGRGNWHAKQQDCECKDARAIYHAPVESPYPETEGLEIMYAAREEILKKKSM